MRKSNREIFRKVANKCYLPTNALLLDMIEKNPNFKIAFSLSGVFMEQCEEYGPDVLESFKKLAATGNVEFLAETYYHSLSSIVSLEEFCEQVRMQSDLVQKHFGQVPTVFRNTELIYNNYIANVVAEMGYKGMVTEGTDRHLNGRNPNNLYQPYRFDLQAAEKKTIRKHRVHKRKTNDFSILLKNYKLSDDIAF